MRANARQNEGQHAPSMVKERIGGGARIGVGKLTASPEAVHEEERRDEKAAAAGSVNAIERLTASSMARVSSAPSPSATARKDAAKSATPMATPIRPSGNWAEPVSGARARILRPPQMMQAPG